MSALTSLYISQSYGGLIHLSTNTGIVSGTFTQLQDGVGNNLNLWINSSGAISGSSFTGSLFGTASQAVSASWASSSVTASYALNALTASYALNAASSTGSSFPFTGSAIISGSLIITGSALGNIVSASISSNTCSLDFSRAEYFTSLVSGSTFFNITNPRRGQTVNLLLTTLGVATASFSSNISQVVGASYTPTTVANRKDIITFISWDGVTVYISDVKNLA